MSQDWKEMERVVARKLSEWWGCKFRRTPSSGAWSKNAQRGSVSDDFHGDIVAPPSANFPFSVECKAYEEVELYLSLYGQSNVFKWWDQCMGDARRADRFPMLVMRENRKQHYLVAIDPPGFGLVKDCPLILPRMTLAVGQYPTMLIFDLDNLIKKCPKSLVVQSSTFDVFTRKQ